MRGIVSLLLIAVLVGSSTAALCAPPQDCKKIRDDQNYWQRVETYISTHSEAQFSHSICPDCYDRLVAPEVERLKQETRKKDT